MPNTTKPEHKLTHTALPCSVFDILDAACTALTALAPPDKPCSPFVATSLANLSQLRDLVKAADDATAPDEDCGDWYTYGFFDGCTYDVETIALLARMYQSLKRLTFLTRTITCGPDAESMDALSSAEQVLVDAADRLGGSADIAVTNKQEG